MLFGKNHSEATTPNTSGHSRLKHAIYPENTDKPRFAAYPPCETARRLYAFQFFATAFHDTATIRQLLNLRPAPEFERWLEHMGIMENGRLTAKAGDASMFF